MKLADAFLLRRTGNLDLLRLGLAACVIVSHAWPLALGPGTVEPLEHATGRSLGGWAVLLFFFLSGLLITASARRRSALAFWRARARRIFPGLGVALLVTLGLAYASGATAPLAEAAAWAIRALALISIEHRITGAFAANPYPGVVNGPLWSLFYEVVAYGLCMALVTLGLLRQRLWGIGLVAVTGFATLFADLMPARLATFVPLFFAFSLGMTAYQFRNRLDLRPDLGAVSALGAVALPGPLAIVGVCYAALALTLTARPLRLTADYSYGLYIYGWPVAQVLVSLLPGIGPVPLAVLSLWLTLPFAMFSWHLVEHPALTRTTAPVPS